LLNWNLTGEQHAFAKLRDLDRDRKVLHMCRQLEACVESPAAAQITVSTVHKAKGLERPRLLMSSDFINSSS
jgi:hypothetical protein